MNKLENDEHCGETIQCLVYEGLCNRLNGIASALAASPRVSLSWAINVHCPVPFEAVFYGIDGLEVKNEQVDVYKRSSTKERLCWFYPQNVSGVPVELFRERLCTAYRTLHESMKVDTFAKPSKRSLALAYRHFIPVHEKDKLESFLWDVGHACEILRPESVHVASDSQEMKRVLLSHLETMGIKTTANDCDLLDNDLERSGDSVMGMAMDLKSMSLCALGVICNNARSTVPDSLRAYEVPVYHTFDDGVHRIKGQDHLFEQQKVASLWE